MGLGILLASGSTRCWAPPASAPAARRSCSRPRSFIAAAVVGTRRHPALGRPPGVEGHHHPAGRRAARRLQLPRPVDATRGIIGSIMVVVGAAALALGAVHPARHGAAAARHDRRRRARLPGRRHAEPGRGRAGAARARRSPCGRSRPSGHLAEENAARNPRRTASTASALMIGLALVTLALVVGTSLKDVVHQDGQQLDHRRLVRLDRVVLRVRPGVATKLKAVPELSAVAALSPGQGPGRRLDQAVSAVDFGVLTEVFNIGLTRGRSRPPGSPGCSCRRTRPRTSASQVGDQLTVVFNDTGPVTLPGGRASTTTPACSATGSSTSTPSPPTPPPSSTPIVAAKTADGVERGRRPGRHREGARALPGPEAAGPQGVHAPRA